MFAEHKPLTPFEEGIRRTGTRLYPGLNDLYAATYELMHAARLSNFFYIADVFNNGRETLYHDSGHISSEGNRIVASRIYEIVKDQGL